MLRAAGLGGLAAAARVSEAGALEHRLPLSAGKLEAIVVDNHDGLAGAAQEERRRAMPATAGNQGQLFSTVPFEERFNGYNGVARLRHDGSPSPFVPALSGLNCEFIFDEREPDYEPRWKSIADFEAQDSRVERLSPAAARLVIEPGRRFGVRVETRFEIVAPHFLDVDVGFTATDEARVPREALGVLWACYMHVPRIPQLYFLGRDRPSEAMRWVGSFEALRLESGGSVAPESPRVEPRLAGKHPLLYRIAGTRFVKPFFCGRVNDLLFASLFEPGPQVEVRFSFNTAGAGPGCPAWDYQAVVARPQAGRRYGFRQRVAYKPFEGLEEAEQLYDRWARRA
jgi:hypothetical protein